MSKKTKISLLVAILLSLLGSAMLGIAIQQQSYPDTKNLNQAYQEVIHAPTGQKTVLIFHKPGCNRCEGAKKAVRKVVKEVKQKDAKMNFVIINVNRADAQQFLHHFSVGQYPYLIVLAGQQEKASFSSTQFHIMEKNLSVALEEKKL
ncbi:thioredoxin domain-containing protein [Fructobacillus tropaeoli]|uniref:thioredoxin domain-containing protein n=1 Tax=Fructobacillus tropaeoli TaxID=709323 RepID=UPI002DA4BE4C|nr:Thiol-disulfide isomerase or thioredoxin (TrxA) [Fructobacillus tropaeoli]